MNDMARDVFSVKMTPLEAQKMVEKNLEADLVSVDIYNLENNKSIIVTIFEKYYARSNSDAGLVVICENTTGKTLVKITSTGSAIGLSQIDWGTGNNLIKRVKKILIDYII
ncbi:hypothetical protein EWM37_08250 [Clostridioides difficile]|nr:DUF6054 family protein [Clostridioides difficile]CCL14621.1 Conserved hypothetical protein [Clostridioides difficile T22]CCL18698.1 Conserved hypothetical protein [Clostridioides difficile E25]CCL22629.1 Conserved hypothetical protein [Clostridioides difficile T15]CCL49707.1 Conserved hypothetical protein [Clostridioides difficile T6]EGT4547977.1 hypothetical protein [Clostridioides difficile]